MELISKLTSTRSSEVWRCQTIDGSIQIAKLVEANSRNLFELFVSTAISHPYLNSLTSAEIIEQNDRPNDPLICLVSDCAVTDLALRVRSSPVDLNVIQSWIRMILMAIDELHAHKIVHGDIKAKNILLTVDNQIKLTDFGLSFFELTNTGHSVCTYTHRPIEAWLKRELSIKLDIWSLGCTIFELLAGRSLFPTQDFDTETFDKDLLKARMINCILDWADRYNQVGEYQVYRTSVNFRPANMPAYLDRSEYANLKSLLLDCLQLEPHQRLSSNQLLNKYFGVTRLDSIQLKPITPLIDQVKQRMLARFKLNAEDRNVLGHIFNLLIKRDVGKLSRAQIKVLELFNLSFK
jgi:serine/threonine protein kinase